MNDLLSTFWLVRKWRVVVTMLLGGGLSLGCQSARQHPETNNTGRQDNPSQKASEQIAPEKKANASQNSETSRPEDSSATSAPSSRFLMALPAQKEFLEQALPVKNVARYQKWSETWRLSVNQSHLYVAASLGSDKHVIVRSDDEASVRVYEKQSKKLVGNYALGGQQFEWTPILPWVPTHGVAVGNSELFLHGSSHGLQLVEATTGTVRKTFDDAHYGEIAWSPDAQILVADARRDPQDPSNLSFFQRNQEDELVFLESLKFAERVDAWDLSRDNRMLVVSYYPSNTIEIFDLQTGSTISKFVGQDYVGSLTFSPDGRALAIAGQGLLLVDLLTPAKRAYYSDFGNNISAVSFSPSADAIATSSYDGKIRIFDYTLTPASLSLVKTLSHTGTANVYSLEFAPSGDELMSASGDQTVRRFGAPRSKTESQVSSEKFRTLAEWREFLPQAEQTAPPLIEPSMRDGHYFPPSLDGPARPSRIRPGKYACKITAIYKLRTCLVTVNEAGHTLLKFENDNLLGLNGVLYDDGAVTRYEAWVTKASIYDCSGCEKQPLQGVFRGNGNNFSGLLLMRNYYDEYSAPPLPPADIKIEEKDDRLPMTLQFREPLPASSVSRD